MKIKDITFCCERCESHWKLNDIDIPDLQKFLALIFHADKCKVKK